MKHYKGRYSQEIADLMNDTFGTRFTAEQMGNYRARNKLQSGLTGRFEKGQIPHNKGKKMPPDVYERCKGTMFKKGQKNWNDIYEIGDERLISGYVYIKIADGGRDYRDRYKLKHHIVWESVHGVIPDKHCVIFLDGDRTNAKIENLELVHRQHERLMNTHNLRSSDPNLTKAGLTLMKLNGKILKQRRKNYAKKHSEGLE